MFGPFTHHFNTIFEHTAAIQVSRSFMRVGSKEYQRLREIVKDDPGISASDAVKKLHQDSVADNAAVEILSLRTIAARYLNNLGFFGGI